MTEALTELLERTERAAGLDRWLFTNIAEVVFADFAPSPKWWIKQTILLDAEAWTDAALALCSRVLPGRGWSVRHNTNARGPVGAIYEPDDPAAGILDPWPPRYESLGATPALALLAAMLKALIAGDQS